MRSTGGFGAPKPLPGQRGHGSKKSDKLEAEAGKMEVRLQALRMQMSKEKQARESSANVGGSRWRSAEKTRGSMRNYAKDVKDRPREKKDKPERLAMSSTAPVQKTTARASFDQKTVGQWTCDDVTEWLQAISMDAHAEQFNKNEINGQVLLEVGLDDLDYMQITKLGHRKLLLKSIGELKKNGGMFASGAENKRPSSRQINRSEMAAAGAAETKSRSPQRQPLSQNECESAGPRGQPPRRERSQG